MSENFGYQAHVDLASVFGRRGGARSDAAVAWFALALLIGVVPAVGCSRNHKSATPVLEGSALWGGDGAEVRITDNLTTFYFLCATGRTAEPITIDEQGNFDLRGFYRPTGGARRDTETNEVPARFRGRIANDEMKLTVEMNDASSSTSYSLHRGVAGDVRACP